MTSSIGFFTLRLALVIPFLFHGFWNILSSGDGFWREHVFYPEWLRYGVGGLEIEIAIALLIRFQIRIHSLIALLLMLGAIKEHLSFGYSFKENGYETPLTYALISIVVFFMTSDEARSTRGLQTSHRDKG